MHVFFFFFFFFFFLNGSAHNYHFGESTFILGILRKSELIFILILFILILLMKFP